MFPNESTIYVGRASEGSNTGSLIYNTLYRELGQNALYLQIRPADGRQLANGIRELNFRGCTVVDSFADEILPFLDELDPHAQRVGAVNTVVNVGGKLIGHKTDGPALVDCIEETSPINNKRIVILGAGHLARELLLLLASKPVSTVTVYNRTPEKAEALCEEFGFRFGGGLDDVLNSEGDILINATDIGSLWSDTKNFFTIDCISRFDVVVDVTFKPLTTPLQETARNLGKRLTTGSRLFAHQGRRQVQLYLGVEAPVERIWELVQEEFGPQKPA